MNSSPTALFDSYHNDFQQFIATIQDKLEGDPTNDRAGVLRRVDMDLDEVDEMACCLPSFPTSYSYRL